MVTRTGLWRHLAVASGACTLLFACFVAQPGSGNKLEASPLGQLRGCRDCNDLGGGDGGRYVDEFEGTWYWLRSPEQEKRVVMSHFNRYCIRCHQSDGRGTWDIPDVPDFTNLRWQATRSDAQLARVILEGRGSVMPPWRGTLSLEEAWAMARYIRTFVPGTEMPKPDTSKPETAKPDAGKPEPKKP